MKETVKIVIRENQHISLPQAKFRTLNVPDGNGLIITVIGPRRCGKTFLLYKKMSALAEQGVERSRMVFVNFEDERLQLTQSDLDLILQAYREMYPEQSLDEVHFFFDEIQNIEGWEKFVRRVFDTISKHIYISGSNAKLLSTEIATALRGRCLTITAYPLSLKEYLLFQDVPTDHTLQADKSRVIHHAEKFLYQGGFPELLSLDQMFRTRVLQDYLNVMIFRDIVERYNVTNIDVLRYFIRKIFASVTTPFSINKTYNDLKSQGYKISNTYLYDYFEYCNAIFLCQTIRRFDYSDLKQARSEPKCYVIDTGMLSAVEFSMSQNKGKLLENMVFLELIKSGRSVSYHKQNHECDFVLTDGNPEPVQVAYTLNDEDTRRRELKGLAEAAKYIGTNNGTIITFDEEDEFVFGGVDVKVVPAYKYFLG